MHSSQSVRFVTLACLVGVCSVTPTSASGPGANYFTGLGFLPDRSPVSLAFGISDDGRVVVGESRASGFWQAFRWTLGTGMQGLGPGNPFSSAHGASFDGGVIVGNRGPAALWTETTGWQNLTNSENSQALSVSSNGQFVAGNIENQAVRFDTSGQPLFLGSLVPDHASHAAGISGDGGTVVGYGHTEGGDRPFKWTAETGMVQLPTVEGGHSGVAIHVSLDSSTIVGWSSSTLDQEAVYWDEQGLHRMGTLLDADTRSLALDVSGNGDMVVGWSGTALQHRAFIWDEVHGMRNLKKVLMNDFGFDIGGWTLEEATGISADGMTITGFGVNPQGRFEAWVVHVPAPGAWAAFALCGMMASRRRRVQTQPVARV